MIQKNYIFLAAALIWTLSAPSAFGQVNEGFIRGDVNADCAVDIADVIGLGQALSGAGGVASLAAADVDGNLDVNGADLSYLVNYLFYGGPQPPAPISSALCSSSEPSNPTTRSSTAPNSNRQTR